jgi:hypothetical protein
MKRWNKNAVPLLTGVKYESNLIAVWCPYCRKYHIHGWDHAKRADTDAEHRCAHCNDGSPFRNGGYYITVAPRLHDRVANNSITGGKAVP